MLKKIIFVTLCFFSSTQIHASLPRQSAEFFVGHANLEAKKKNYDHALNLLNQAIAKDPNSVRAYKLRGNIYYALENYHAALSDFDMVLRLIPNCANAFVDRAIVLSKLRNFDQALMDVESALLLKPNSSFALLIKEQILELSSEN